MKEHYRQIYTDHAPDYQRLVAREDHHGALLPAIVAVHPLRDATVVELGAGTGRLTRLLAPQARSIAAFDASAAMLAVAQRENVARGITNVTLAVAEHHALPVDDDSADLVAEGWAFGHLMDQANWRTAVDAALGEVDRITRPGGVQLLIETLGTGRTDPAPPSPALTTLFVYLETQGFIRSWCRTDYRFDSPAEAEELVGFFFGAGMVDAVQPGPPTTLAECTGLWARTKAR